MKIILIGPTYPFRGGIAHHTTLLCRALRRKHEVKFISFKRQYPKILFPGKTDRDPSAKPLTVENVEYLIDSMNPLTWIDTARVIREYKPDKVILPLWVSFWTPQFWSILSLVKRHLRPEVVFVCHDAIEHESNFLKRMAKKILLSKADHLVTHSEEETRKLKDILGEDAHITTAFLPTFEEVSKDRYTKEQAREKLGLSGNVLLFFGFVREYKGVGVLLDAMPDILKEREVTLLIVGEFWTEKQKFLDKIDHFGLSQRVRMIDEYVPNEEIAIYFAAADLVVQPYLYVTGSAITQLSYGFDRPVIATHVGFFPEVIEDGVNGRIVKPGDSRELAKAILESLEPASLNHLTYHAAKTKEKFSWERIVKILTGEAVA